VKEELISELENKIDENYNKIIANMNRLHSHEEQINSNTQKIKENSYALEIVRDYKKASRRHFISMLLFAVCWLLTLVLLLFK
jgi:hypothetical protein